MILRNAGFYRREGTWDGNPYYVMEPDIQEWFEKIYIYSVFSKTYWLIGMELGGCAKVVPVIVGSLRYSALLCRCLNYALRAAVLNRGFKSGKRRFRSSLP